MAFSRPGVAVLARTLHRLDPLVFRLSGGKNTLTGLLSGQPVLFLTVRGAKSGLWRTVPLLSIPQAGNPRHLILVASNWGQQRNPGWAYNLRANSRCNCRVGSEEGEYLAEEIAGELYQECWEQAVRTYPGFRLYRQRTGRKHIPIFLLKPVEVRRMYQAQDLTG